LNLYTYVGNNPLNWIDPWGLEKEELKGLISNFRRQLRELEKQKHFWEYWECNDYQEKIMEMNLDTKHFELRRMWGVATFGGLGGPRRRFSHLDETASHNFVVVLRRGTLIPVLYLDPWMWGWPGNYSIPKNSVWEPVFGGAIDPYFDFSRPWP